MHTWIAIVWETKVGGLSRQGQPDYKVRSGLQTTKRVGEIAWWLDTGCASTGTWVWIPRTYLTAKWAWWSALTSILRRQKQGVPRAGWLVRLAILMRDGFCWRILPRWIKWKSNQGWFWTSTLGFHVHTCACMCTCMSTVHARARARTHILKHVHALTHMKMKKQKQNKSKQQKISHYFALLAEISVPGPQKVRLVCGRGHQDCDNWCLF